MLQTFFSTIKKASMTAKLSEIQLFKILVLKLVSVNTLFMTWSMAVAVFAVTHMGLFMVGIIS